MAGSPDASTKFKPVPPVSLFAAYGTEIAGHGAGVGLGMNVPAGGNMFWDEDWAGRGRIITVDRKVYGFYLTGGVEVVPGLRAGGGLVYYYTTEYLKHRASSRSRAPTASSRPRAARPPTTSRPSTRRRSARLPLTFAVDYKHKAEQKLKGDGNFVVPDALLTRHHAPARGPGRHPRPHLPERPQRGRRVPAAR